MRWLSSPPSSFWLGWGGRQSAPFTKFLVALIPHPQFFSHWEKGAGLRVRLGAAEQIRNLPDEIRWFVLVCHVRSSLANWWSGFQAGSSVPSSSFSWLQAGPLSLFRCRWIRDEVVEIVLARVGIANDETTLREQPPTLGEQITPFPRQPCPAPAHHRL